jgi:hypothetical protein
MELLDHCRKQVVGFRSRARTSRLRARMKPVQRDEWIDDAVRQDGLARKWESWREALAELIVRKDGD